MSKKRTSSKPVLQLSLFILLTMLVSAVFAAEPTIALTEKERAYLNTIDEIRLCSDPDWLPYEAIDPKTGQHIGIMSEFHQLWSKKIGKPVRLQVTKSWAQALEFVEQGHCDVLSSASENSTRNHYLTVTDSFIRYPLAVATQPDQSFLMYLGILRGERIAVVKGYAGVEIIREHYPELDILLVSNAYQGLKLVEKGVVYAYIDTIPTINYQINKHGIANIKINGVLDHYYEMSVGVRKDLPELLSIFNKAIADTTELERQQVLNHWLSLSIDYPVDLIYALEVGAVVFIVMMLFFIHYRMVTKHNGRG